MAASEAADIAIGAASVYNLHDGCSNETHPRADMTDFTPSHDVAQATSDLDTAAMLPATNVSAQLRTRVVREARRETWFVVNEGSDDIATIPLDLRADATLSRVHVNGEVAEFSADLTSVLVRPRIALRAGAGTIVVLHFK
jgi:hypothetical protein